MLLLRRNQSIDLHSKFMDWFLHITLGWNGLRLTSIFTNEESISIGNSILREVSVFGVFLVSIFPHSDWYSVRMRENTDQKNSEYIHFSRNSVILGFLKNNTRACYKNFKNVYLQLLFRQLKTLLKYLSPMHGRSYWHSEGLVFILTLPLKLWRDFFYQFLPLIF